MITSTPASASFRAYWVSMAFGSRVYSSPQWGNAITISAPASRSRCTSPSKSAVYRYGTPYAFAAASQRVSMPLVPSV